ncbi:unnamed protein product [Adineta ricciae]|uniref:Uncharacterized protein n=1 Tax=Adineta ricciae TaxID=249248 RepID=A0A814JRI9_ADIRI|nr:unnamed protein product [Adineta ricciae]
MKDNEKIQRTYGGGTESAILPHKGNASNAGGNQNAGRNQNPPVDPNATASMTEYGYVYPTANVPVRRPY